LGGARPRSPKVGFSRTFIASTGAFEAKLISVFVTGEGQKRDEKVSLDHGMIGKGREVRTSGVKIRKEFTEKHGGNRGKLTRSTTTIWVDAWLKKHEDPGRRPEKTTFYQVGKHASPRGGWQL